MNEWNTNCDDVNTTEVWVTTEDGTVEKRWSLNGRVKNAIAWKPVMPEQPPEPYVPPLRWRPAEYPRDEWLACQFSDDEVDWTGGILKGRVTERTGARNYIAASGSHYRFCRMIDTGEEKPREFWLASRTAFKTRGAAESEQRFAGSAASEIIHVREIL